MGVSPAVFRFRQMAARENAAALAAACCLWLSAVSTCFFSVLFSCHLFRCPACTHFQITQNAFRDNYLLGMEAGTAQNHFAWERGR